MVSDWCLESHQWRRWNGWQPPPSVSKLETVCVPVESWAAGQIRELR